MQKGASRSAIRPFLYREVNPTGQNSLITDIFDPRIVRENTSRLQCLALMFIAAGIIETSQSWHVGQKLARVLGPMNENPGWVWPCSFVL